MKLQTVDTFNLLLGYSVRHTKFQPQKVGFGLVGNVVHRINKVNQRRLALI